MQFVGQYKICIIQRIVTPTSEDSISERDTPNSYVQEGAVMPTGDGSTRQSGSPNVSDICTNSIINKYKKTYCISKLKIFFL